MRRTFRCARRYQIKSRLGRCDVPLCRRVSNQSRPALIGFEADGAPVENILPVLRSGCHAVPLGEPECRIPLFAAEKPEERREGVGAPSVERAREGRERTGKRA